MKETFSDIPTEGLVVGTHVDPSSSMTRYRAFDLATGETVFERGPFSGHTNNCAGFLAIVHAIAHCRVQKSIHPIYCANSTAIEWVKYGRLRSHITETKNKEEYHNRVRQAQVWLEEYQYPNTLLHWKIKIWGENPATYSPKKPYARVERQTPVERLERLTEEAKKRHL